MFKPVPKATKIRKTDSKASREHKKSTPESLKIRLLRNAGFCKTFETKKKQGPQAARFRHKNQCRK